MNLSIENKIHNTGHVLGKLHNSSVSVTIRRFVSYFHHDDGAGPPRGDGAGPPRGDGEGPPRGDGAGPPRGDGEGLPRGEGEDPPSGDGEDPPSGDGEDQPESDTTPDRRLNQSATGSRGRGFHVH